jgi:hypothetical protein
VRPDARSGSAVSSRPAFPRKRVVSACPRERVGARPGGVGVSSSGDVFPRIVSSHAGCLGLARIVAWLGFGLPTSFFRLGPHRRRAWVESRAAVSRRCAAGGARTPSLAGGPLRVEFPHRCLAPA